MPWIDNGDLDGVEPPGSEDESTLDIQTSARKPKENRE